MKTQLQSVLETVLLGMGVPDVAPAVMISEDARHGDYTTNVAMKLAKPLKKSPMAIALQVKTILDEAISSNKLKSPDQKMRKEDQKYTWSAAQLSILQDIDKVEVVAPGFLNVFLTEASLSSRISQVLKDGERYGTSQTIVPIDLGGNVDGGAEKIMVEFAHPNTHKAFHIGHLRNITTGESLVRLLEATGHEVIRVNYQGDVGMHIAKCLWAMTHLPECDPGLVRGKEIHKRVEFLGKAYAAGSTRYETDEAVKKQTGEINKQIYAKDPVIYPLYQETRAWSLEYFEGIYKRVGTHYDRFYFESEFYELGKKYVEEGLNKGIFEKSDGAIIFPGEKYGLHNRVFITKEDNATYEGKEIGLGRVQFDEYHPDVIIHVVGPEQAGYFQVLFAALAQIFPDTKGKEYHKVYGWVKLKHGKMSSRTGQVVLGEWLLDEARQSVLEILKQSKSNYTEEDQKEIAEKGAIAAVKYAFLRVGTDQEIAFDLKESVSFDGDSGPYLLYTYARSKSVLRKAEGVESHIGSGQLNAEERALARFISFYPEIVSDAARTLSPSVLCSYLFKLAALFNLLYQKHPILNSPQRLALTTAAAQVLKNGLFLLGISTVERM
ncbi:arginine--tRNA ligase [Patescibacteria group bacterium]|nr:arginine--tRNA ligase [Patescibacteria group bacterium]